jgi:exodeoxyribonuclease V alpha subunit
MSTAHDRRGARGVVNNSRQPQAHSPPQEVLAGLVERVTYHNAENGFCVLREHARISADFKAIFRMYLSPDASFDWRASG